MQALSLESFRTQPESCFACGPKNPHGLHAHFAQSAEGAEANFIPTRHHEGWPGIIHGGILVTLLDEAMAYALYYRRIAAVTVRLESRFRRPASPGETLKVRANVVAERRGIIDVRSEITGPDGSVIAGANGRFVPVGSFEG